MKDQLRKRMFKKRRYRTYNLSIANGVSIQMSAYALLRPTVPGFPINIIIKYSLLDIIYVL